MLALSRYDVAFGRYCTGFDPTLNIISLPWGGIVGLIPFFLHLSIFHYNQRTVKPHRLGHNFSSNTLVMPLFCLYRDRYHSAKRRVLIKQKHHDVMAAQLAAQAAEYKRKKLKMKLQVVCPVRFNNAGHRAVGIKQKRTY